MTDLVKLETTSITIKPDNTVGTKLVNENNVTKVSVETTVTKVVAEDNTTPIKTIGIQGPAGIDGDKHYAHTQSVASAEWNITHNLVKFPSITVVDSAGTTVIGEEQMIDLNTVKLTFSAPFSGKAYLN